MRDLFRNRNFSLLFSGQLVSVFGNNIFMLALPWFVYSMTGSKADLAIVGFAQSVPQLVGLASGVYVDRWRKKQTMIWSDIIRTVISLGVFVFAAAHLSFWFIAWMVFLLEAIGTFFNPASTALLPMIIEESRLPQAMGLDQSSQAAVQLAGQFGGGTLLAVFGAPILFLINAITFLVSVLSLGWLKSEEPARAEQNRAFVQQWKEGMRAITRSRLLLLVIVAALIANFSFAPFDIVLTAWVKGPLHASPVWLGAIGGAFFVGMMLGGMTVGAVTNHLPLKKIVMIGLLLSGLLVAAIGFDANRIVSLVIIFFAGIVNGIMNGALGAMLVQSIPKDLRGRVIATTNALAKLAMPLGMAVFGALMMYLSLSFILILMGAMCVLGGLSFLIPVADDLQQMNAREEGSVEIGSN